MLSSAALPLALLFFGATTLIIADLARRRSRLLIERRVNLVVGRGSGATVTFGTQLKARSKQFDERLRGVFALGARRSWGMHIRAVVLMPAAVISGGLVWVLAHPTLGLPAWLATLLAVIASFLGPRSLLMREQQRTERQFTELFPDALDTAVRMLRAGLPITSGLQFISTTAAPPVSTVFAMIANQAEIGIPIEEVLETNSQEVGLPDFRYFAVAVVLQRATGGNLASTLEILSEIIRKRRAVRLKAKSATAEIRVSAYVLGALPFLVVGALLLINPDYLTPLFADRRGHLILALAGGSLLVALLLMRQMIRRVTNI